MGDNGGEKGINMQEIVWGDFRDTTEKNCFCDEKALAGCGGGLQTLQVACFKTCLVSEGRGFFISLYVALSCACRGTDRGLWK